MLLGAGFIWWGYLYITRDMPNVTSIDDYRPPAVSKVLAQDGTLVGEFFAERRYPVKFKEIPLLVVRAFLAAEDASFYNHPGIDFFSIVRATYKNLRQGSAKQGGSTITQQVVKNLLLSPERNIKRKLKEAILSYQLEQRLSKDEILEIYLNQIFFGNTAYGIKAAALAYFHKDLDQLTLGEAALLAGLPKAPSHYSPLLYPAEAKQRRRYVLGQMVKVGFISGQDAEQAAEEPLVVYSASKDNIYRAPYYVSEVRRIWETRWKNYDIDRDGLEIHTALDVHAYEMGVKALRKGLSEVDRRRGWRGPIDDIFKADLEIYKQKYGSQVPADLEDDAIYPAMIIGVESDKIKARLGVNDINLSLKDSSWIRQMRSKDDQLQGTDPLAVLRIGKIIEVTRRKSSNASNAPPAYFIAQSPEIEGALVLIDPHTGYVQTLIGGYNYQRSVFNRASQSYRQPGSAFKPIVYLSAVDGFHYTPATIVHDEPRSYHVGDQIWSPGNFDEKYMGPITLRTALQLSRNLVSAEIISRIGIDPVIQYAKKIGIETRLGRNPSLSLGSSELTLLELTRAYGVFSAKGVLFDSVFITKIVDRNGQVLFDMNQDKLLQAHQVIDENSAFIMANMMKGVVERGTGQRVKAIGRPVAGKTGTSNEQMDAWFIGFTPQWVCGVWAGFDLKKKIGDQETGGRVAAPIWLYFMSDFLKAKDAAAYQQLVEESKSEAVRLGIEYVPPPLLPPLDFSVPDGVDPYWVDKHSGELSDPSNPNAIYEYFLKGTQPGRNAQQTTEVSSYLDSPEL